MSANLEKPTPIECLEQHIAMTEARQMRPEDLTREDCQRLLEAGFPRNVIARVYGLSDSDLFFKLKEWGLNKPLKDWDPRSDRRKEKSNDGPSRLTPADLTREQAARMLLAGVSKPDIRRKYNFPNAPALYAQLEEWGLHKKGLPSDFKSKTEEVRKMAAAVLKEIEQEKQILQTKTELTEEEKLDLFGESEPSIGEAVQKAAEVRGVKVETTDNSTSELFSVDLSTWEPVDFTRVQHITAPYLWVSAKGHGVIGNTNLRPGSRVQFRIDPTGWRVAVIPAKQGQLLYNEEAKQRRRFSSNHLARRLQAKGIKLPARFHLEWNEAAGAYIGVLVEKIEKPESEAV